jgi:hypothetical protein
MKYLALLASILIMYILGQIIVSYFAFFGLAPNLLLLLLIILAFDEKSLNFLFVAIVGGDLDRIWTPPKNGVNFQSPATQINERTSGILAQNGLLCVAGEAKSQKKGGKNRLPSAGI